MTLLFHNNVVLLGMTEWGNLLRNFSCHVVVDKLHFEHVDNSSCLIHAINSNLKDIAS